MFTIITDRAITTLYHNLAFESRAQLNCSYTNTEVHLSKSEHGNLHFLSHQIKKNIMKVTLRCREERYPCYSSLRRFPIIPVTLHR